MRRDAFGKIPGILARYRRHRAWRKVVRVMACVVVFCTTYALILPAITLEKKPLCGMEEHTHTEDCYTQVTSEEKRVPSCTLEGGGPVAHRHDDRCYDENGQMWCTLPELGVHTHTDGCYAPQEVHTHGEGCYQKERGELVCALTEGEAAHTHSREADCYKETKELTCGLEESDGHTHDDGCKDETGALACGLEESQGHHHLEACYVTGEELVCTLSDQPHQHTDECYAWKDVLTCTESTEPGEPVLICGKEALELHEHSEECYGTDGEPVCGKPRVIGHAHTDACFKTVENQVDTGSLTCGIGEGEGAHTHGEGCYDENNNLTCTLTESQGHTHTKLCYGTWNLTCGKEEHTHTEECMVEVESEEDWKKSLPETLKNDWREDLLTVAESQLDYAEARPDFRLGEEPRRWSRYGEWYGQPEGDWNSLFVMFCLHYAGIPEESLPRDSDIAAWVEKLAGRAEGFEEFQLYHCDEDYTPRPGDLVFFGLDEDEAADRVGIVTKVGSGLARSSSPVGSGLARSSEEDTEDNMSLRASANTGVAIPSMDGTAPESAGEQASLLPTDAEPDASPVGNGLARSSEEDTASNGTAPESAGEQASLLPTDAEPDASSVGSGLARSLSTEQPPVILETIEGDVSGRVARRSYPMEGVRILGYAQLPEKPEEKPVEITTRTVQGADYTVTVTYGPEAAIPAEAELRAEEYPRDSEVYQARYAQAAAMYGWTGDRRESVRLFNVGFYVGDREIEPAAPVDVSITYAQPNAIGCQVTHFPAELPEALEGIAPLSEPAAETAAASPPGEQAETLDAELTPGENGSQTVNFTLDGFSQIMLAMDVPAGIISPDALDGKSFTLYCPDYQGTSNSIWWYVGYFFPDPVSDVTFSPKKNCFYTAVTANADIRNRFVNITRQWTFKKTEDGSGCYLKVGAVGANENYLVYQDGAFTTSTTEGSIFTVVEGTGPLEKQVMLRCGDYVVGMPNSSYQLSSVPVATAISDPECHFYMVDRARLPVGTVQGITPSGTVINMFDYWVVAPNAIDQSIKVDQDDADHRDDPDAGINKGHVLKFLSEARETNKEWNYDASKRGEASNAVYQGLVQKTLDENGYPQLDPNRRSDDGKYILGSSESLAYLFDPDFENPYRSVHRNIGGLLQLNEEGYHYYSSKENYAYLGEADGQDTANRAITLYDKRAIIPTTNPTGTASDGQFFPFTDYDTASELTEGGVQDLNHYFGLTLTARFYQQKDGMRGKNTPITFEFSGDDDVWIFIDDVLVADLGGIHGASSVVINFQTGTVTINDKDDTTIKAAFEEAGRSIAFNGNTLPNNTYHTLRFFYMERGASQSNLSLRYNLVTFPTAGITKVDQVGNPVPGAEFKLYHADANYNYAESNLVCGGITTSTGDFIFLDSDNQPMALPEMYKTYYQSPYFVLKETKIPEGYRGTGADIHLRIHTNLPPGEEPREQLDNIPFVMVCDNTSECGAWAVPILQVFAPNSFSTTAKPGETVTFYDPDTGTLTGSLFAVVLKYVGDGTTGLTDQNNWRPVYGSAKDGYTIVDPTKYPTYTDAVLEAACHYGRTNYFQVGSSGRLEAMIEELPGDIRTYNFLAGNQEGDHPKYIVAYYYTGTDGTTSRVRDFNETGNYLFTRNFGTSIQVPNMVNRIAVQKLDKDTDEPLNGATFAAYRVEDTDPGGGAHEENNYFYVADSDKAIHLYLEPDTDGTYSGQAKNCFDRGDWTGTYTVDSDTGVISVTLRNTSKKPGLYTISPVAKEITVSASENNYLEDGIAEFEKIPTGKYIIRELTAPSGYSVNPNHAMVLVTGNAVYANAGTETDDIAVSRGPGYLAGNLHYYASFGEIESSLTWIYDQMKVSEPSEKFSDITSLNYDTWKWVQTKRADANKPGAAEPTENRKNALTAYLEFIDPGSGGEGETSARFSYAVDPDPDRPHTVSNNVGPFRRLYTPTGWSYLEILQDYDYGINAKKPNADYADWRYTTDASGKQIPDDLSNLFSRSVYIHVADPRLPGDLEISKTVAMKNGTVLTEEQKNQEFPFTVSLTNPKTPLAESYKYTVYDISESGRTVATENGTELKDLTLTFTDGTATLSLKHNQVAVIQDIPAGTTYVIQENTPDKYITTAEEKVLEGNAAEWKTHTSATVSGTMYWNGEDRTSQVKFTNAYDKDLNTVKITVRKVNAEDQTARLADAEFTLTRTVTGTGKIQYNNGSDWVDEPTVLTTTPISGEISFLQIEKNGTYTLTETKAPEGYYPLTEPITITVETTTTAEGTEKTAVTAKMGDVTLAVAADNSLTLIVPNQCGYELPQSGGTGTTGLYAAGTLLLLTALLLLLPKRKPMKK